MPLKPAAPRSRAPLDQAHGLRQMFGGTDVHFVPLVHNPNVAFGGVVMERLCTAMAERGMNVLVADAADSASCPHELAPVDLSACVEPLSHRVSYLAARGLPLHYLDARATTAGFLQALADAAPRAQVVLLHAGAADLRRMFAGRTPRPVLLVGPRPDSLTEAYASMKLLSQRLGALTYDVVITGDVSERRARTIGDRLSDCADHFLGAAVGLTAVVDPNGGPRLPVSEALLRLASAQLKRPGDAPDPWQPALPIVPPAAARSAARGHLN